MNKRLLATLEKAATSGDGDWFEDEVYRLLKKIVPFVVPFGAQYKGFSVPDGMIFGGTAYPFPTLFTIVSRQLMMITQLNQKLQCR